MKRVLMICASILCLTGALAVPGASAARAHHHRTHHRKAHRHRAPSQATVAKRLVRNLGHAHGTTARALAIRSMAKALHIGVETAAGRQVVASPEPRAARRYAMYTFELRALAGQDVRKTTISLTDLSQRLAKLGLKLDATRPLPPRLLYLALRSAVRKAGKTPRNPRSLLPLLVRELGRKGAGADPGSAKSVGAVRLDAVQAWLVTTDIAIPVLRRAAVTHTATAARSVVRARTAASTSSCEDFDKDSDAIAKRYDDAVEKATGSKIGAWAAKKGIGKIYDAVKGQLVHKAIWGIRRLPGWASTGVIVGIRAAKLVGPVVDGLHGVLLAFSIDVESLHPSLAPVHWYHTASEQYPPDSHERTFEVKVSMRDDLGERFVHCAALAGYKVPPKGPIDNVRVVWLQAEGDLDPDQADLHCTLVCTTITGSDGVARLSFKPRREDYYPNIQPTEVQKTGLMEGLPLYQSSQDAGVAGKVAQFIVPKTASTRWFVSHHDEAKLVLTYDHSLVDDSTVESQTPYEHYTTTTHTNWALRGSVALQAGGGNGDFLGSGPLSWVYSQYHQKSEGSGANNQGGQCGSISTTDLIQPFGATASVPTTSITTDANGEHVDSVDFDPGAIHATLQSNETTTSGPCPSGGTSTQDSKQFLFNFNAVHHREIVYPPGQLTESHRIHITGWTPGTGNVIATKTYTEPNPAGNNGSGQYVDTFQIVATKDAK